MEFEWDEAKNASNLAKHGVDFLLMTGFDWQRASFRVDDRREYGEQRVLGYGPAGDGQLYVMAFTMRDGRCRIISARRFGRKDSQFYEPPNIG